MKNFLLMPVFLLAGGLAFAAQEPSALLSSSSSTVSTARIASVFVSEDFINQLLKENLKAKMLQDVVIHLDTVANQIEARGLLKIPVEDMKAVNVEEGIGNFRFQLAIRLKATRSGHLILIFPLDQTYFYPDGSSDTVKDRVIIPVQLLSIALASARGQLAVMSGDFSGFDRQAAQLKLQMADIDRQIAATHDPDEREGLGIDRKTVQNQLDALPLERREGEKLAKKMQSFMGFVGEKEINLNQELAAHRNALIVRIQMGQLAPYLQGIELGGVRLLKDERDGSGENFLAVDVNAALDGVYPVDIRKHGPVKKIIRRPPLVVIRLNQALLESKAVTGAEQENLGPHIRNFAIDLKEDGIHASGDWHESLLPRIPFTAVVDFVWTAPNVFEIRVRDVKVFHVDLSALTGIVLEAAKSRLDKALKGACTFEYVGKEKDHSRAMRVTVTMTALLPAFPNLVLTGIDVKEKELLLKAGQP